MDPIICGMKLLLKRCQWFVDEKTSTLRFDSAVIPHLNQLIQFQSGKNLGILRIKQLALNHSVLRQVESSH